MENNRTFSSLFQQMYSEQVTAIIHENIAIAINQPLFKDIFKGKLNNLIQNIIPLTYSYLNTPVHIVYVLDPYDIMNYCFPFGFKMQKKIQGSDLDRLSDSMTSWHDLYNSMGRFVLMDEHRSEMGRLRNRLVHDLRQQIDEFDQFEKLVQDIYSYSSNISEDQGRKIEEEIFQKRLPWLMAAATGELNKAPDRYINLFKKLIINVDAVDSAITPPWLSSDEREFHINTIKEVFDTVKAGNRAIDNYLKKIDALNDKKVDVDENRKDRLLVDYQVSDRLIAINKMFAKKADELNCRYIFLYLVSDYKSKFISRDMKNKFPKVLGQPMNLYRSVSQLWLSYLMSANVLDESNSRDELKSLEVFIQNLIIAYNSIKNRSSLPKEMDEKISSLRERVEWKGIIKNISDYPGQLMEAFGELKNRSRFEPLKSAFGELIKTLRNSQARETLSNFEKEIRSFNIQVTVFQKIFSVLARNIYPDISSFGYIVGINHHLPTLFKKSDSESKYKELIDRTVKVILLPGGEDDFSTELKRLARDLKAMLLIDELGDIQQGLRHENLKDELSHYERQTLLYLFALLLPAHNLSGQSFSEKEGESNLDNELDELLLYDIRSLENRIGHNHLQINIKNDFDRILGNLQYIRIWSLRRNHKLDECGRFLSRILDEHEEIPDIRFIHGLALLSYSRLLSVIIDRDLNVVDYFDPDTTIKKIWKQAQKDTVKAKTAFESLRNTSFDPIIQDKAHSAILNTLIYIEILGYAMNRDFSRLKMARKLINDEMSHFEDERRSHPEYLHTEAHLEYFEAQYYLPKDRNKSFSKINFASDAICRCIILTKKFFPHKKLDEDYEKLNIAIEKFKRANFHNEL